jgi:hypothetical protein
MEEGWTEQHEKAFPLTSADLLMEEFDKDNSLNLTMPHDILRKKRMKELLSVTEETGV